MTDMTLETMAAAPARSVPLAPVGRPPRPGALSNALVFGWRAALKFKHVPEQLFDLVMTPIMFTLLFTFVFGGALAGSTGDYLQFFLPGILVQTVIFNSGSAPARDVFVEGALFNASPDQDQILSQFFAKSEGQGGDRISIPPLGRVYRSRRRSATTPSDSRISPSTPTVRKPANRERSDTMSRTPSCPS